MAHSEPHNDLCGEPTRRLGVMTDVGKARGAKGWINQDAVMAVTVSAGTTSTRCVHQRQMTSTLGAPARTNLDIPTFHVLAVADGVGGGVRGEDASRIALEAISGTVISGILGGAQYPEVDVSLTAPHPERAPYLGLLAEGIRRANDNVSQDKRPEDTKSVTTTAVCAIVKGRRAYLANIGDSRAYVIGPSGIKQVTEDQYDPPGSDVPRTIGRYKNPNPDLKELELDSFEHLLLCSDGLTLHLTDRQILDKVWTGDGPVPHPQKVCEDLVKDANEAGGGDNISAVLLSLAGSIVL